MDGDFRVGKWVVRPRHLRIDRNGTSVHVKPKSMAVLQYLASANGRVVSRNDILDEVWSGAAVTNDVLTQCVVELRKAFGDSSRHPRIIETIPKVGLRLVPDVSILDEQGPRYRRSALLFPRLGVVVVALLVIGLLVWPQLRERGPASVPAPHKSVAVLPFVDMSPDKGQEYLAEGMAEELTTQLSGIEGLVVYGPRLDFLFTNISQDQSDRSAPRTVDFLLDGSVQKIDSRLRITAELVDSSRGAHLWSHSFDRPYADLLDVQREIAEAVARAVSVELEVGHPGLRSGGTANVDAYEQVMLGDHRVDFSTEGIAEAIRHYRTAAELDPDFGIAWQRIAMSYDLAPIVFGASRSAEFGELADRAIARALALAPDSRRVLLTAANLQMGKENWTEARRLFDEAEAVHAVPVRRLLGTTELTNVHLDLLLKPGYVAELAQLIEDVQRVRPLAPTYGAHLAHAYHGQRRYGEAMAELEAAFANPRGRSAVALEGVLVGLSIRDEELIRLWAERAVRHGVPSLGGATAAMLERFGQRELALAWLHEAFDSGPDTDYCVVAWASYYGDEQLALRALQRSRDPWMFWIPLTEGVRSGEAFKQMLRDMGLVDYWRHYGWNNYCYPTSAAEFECS